MTGADRLRQIREATGTGLNEFAKLRGLSSGYVSNIETGRRSPLLETVPRLAEAYGLSVMEFVALWFDKEPS